MTDATPLLLKANLKQLKLPTMLAEHDKLSREAADRDESYDAYLLKLTELEVADRYERRSLLITSNLPFGEWGTIF